MITTVDPNVLLDVFGADPTFGATSKEALGASLDAGRLVVCDLVWAETVAAFPDEQAAEEALDEVKVASWPPSNAQLPGQAQPGVSTERQAGTGAGW